MLLARAVSALLDTLAPPGCAACDSPSRVAFCGACGPPLPPTEKRALDGLPLITVGRYAAPLSTAIVRFKYQGRAELAPSLGRLLASELNGLALPEGTVFVPVPLHPRRLAARGYNQAALVARELSRAGRLRCEPRLLMRTRDTEHQVGKAAAGRLANTSGAFALRKTGPLFAVLVDDVVTTGATVQACAETLALGGIAVVAVAALAEAAALPY